MLGIVSPAAAITAVPVAAACIGFIVWNHAPASIFMGDSGSQFLGLIIGATLLRGASGTVEVIPAALLLGVLLFDTGFTLVRRARARRDLFSGHREHLYQRLGLISSHREVAAGYAAATAIMGLAGLAWIEAGPLVQVAILGATVAGAVTYVVWVTRLEASVVV
jgi:UDP-N-acetylmuramyl pentapeptide phosphotransferase/UDP-N-acetylglucosamine-1-phosphate transferase